MSGLVDWRIIESMTGWATRMGDEQVEVWDRQSSPDGKGSWNGRIVMERKFSLAQISSLDLRPTDTVLDACCGPGRLTIPLAQRGVKKVTGLDSGANMLNMLRKNAAEAGVTNIEPLQLNWHKCEPGVDFPKHDVAMACISPAHADIVKFSKAATRRCYFLAFSGTTAFRHCLAEIFAGASQRMGGLGGDPFASLPNGSDRPFVAEKGRKRLFGLNVQFNVLYDLGVNPSVTYADGGWEYEAPTKEGIYEFLEGFDTVVPGKEDVFRANADKRITRLEDGGYRYLYPEQMYVLSWDPNELRLD